jgi:hypothetical protein
MRGWWCRWTPYVYDSHCYDENNNRICNKNTDNYPLYPIGKAGEIDLKACDLTWKSNLSYDKKFAACCVNILEGNHVNFYESTYYGCICKVYEIFEPKSDEYNTFLSKHC